MNNQETHYLFYAAPEKISGKTIKIAGPEIHHIKNVLRKKQDDIIQFTDGKGRLYKTVITNIKHDRMTVDIIEKTDFERTSTLAVGLAFVPVKGNRNDFVVEKGTELGVRKFMLFISNNSVVKDLSITRVSRYNKIAISAMLQSQQYYLPEVVPAHDVLAIFKDYDVVVVADKGGCVDIPASGMRILCIVGPEGGFTAEEILRFQKNGARLLSLGRNRLRSETAAVSGIVKILMAYRQI